MVFNRSKNKMGGFDDHEDMCNTGLGLGLSYEGKLENGLLKSNVHDQKKVLSFKFNQNQFFTTTTSSSTSLEPSLTLGLINSDVIAEKIEVNKSYESVDVHRQTSSPNSGLSNSFSNTRSSVKREKEFLGSEEMEVEKISSRVISDEDDEGSARKKLRLTKEQSALLEESFKEHSTLNPKQKQALAKQLNLRPRQVEVWFQNRRARTKLKQTEVDCELLKKCCETLTEENRRLHKELQELKALKLAPPPPMYMQLPAATLTMCPSCERIGGSGGGGGGGAADSSSKNNSFTMAPKPHFYNPFNHPSAAC